MLALLVLHCIRKSVGHRVLFVVCSWGVGIAKGCLGFVGGVELAPSVAQIFGARVAGLALSVARTFGPRVARL